MQNFSSIPANLTSQDSIDFIQIFANDKRMILYRPEWRKFTGSVLATILLQQIIFRWDQNGRQPFYKFKAPCEHSLYRDGDSWLEELGFSTREFDNAIQKIGFKKSAKKNHPHDKPVEYWIDPSRITHYSINVENLQKYLVAIYGTSGPENGGQSGNIGNDNTGSPVKPKRAVTKNAKDDFSVNPESAFTEIRKAHLVYNESETTSEKTTTAVAAVSLVEKIPEEHREELTPVIEAKLKAGKAPESVLLNLLYTISRKPAKLKMYASKAIDNAYAENSAWSPDTENHARKAAEKAQQEELLRITEEKAREKKMELELERRQQIKTRFLSLPLSEKGRLRNEFLKIANPINARLVLKVPVTETCRNLAFMDYFDGLSG